MKKAILFAARHPWAILFIVIALSLVATLQLQHLKFNISAQSMMLKDGEDAAFYQKTLATFGSEDITILYLSDAALFEPHKLLAIKQAIDAIDALPFVNRTESLFSVANAKTIDEQIDLSPYLQQIPNSLAAAQSIRHSALNNPFIKDNLLSASGNSMAINIYLNANTEDAEFDQQVTQQLEQIIQPLNAQLTSAFQLGSAYIRTSISNKILADQKNILPLALAILLITLGLTLRRLSGMLIPTITASISVLWTLGLMATLDISINVMTSIVPALLVIIGSTEDIHLLSEYLSGIKKGLDKNAAIRRMSNKLALAVSLTFITTYFGFLSISLNNLQLLKEFGLVASTGILLNFIITVLLVPVLLKLFASAQPPASSSSNTLAQTIASRVYRFTNQRRRGTIVISAIVFVIAAGGTSLLQVNNNALDNFATDSPIKQRIHTLQNDLSGMQTFSVVISSGIEGTFLKSRYLQEVSMLQGFLKESGIADKTLSFVDYVKVINRAMEDEDDEALYLPDDDALIQEYMLFVDHKKISSFVSADFSQVQILVRHHIESSHELGLALDKIQQFSNANLDPGLALKTTGQSVLSASAADYLATAQAKSLMLMILVITIIIGLLFVNFKAGLFAVIPNLFPIIILFGFMGFAGIPLDTGTAMTAAIAIGICVDDTMHFMVRYHQISKTEKDEQRILEQTVQQEATPIISTSIALALGFAALGLSDFPPIANFGMLSALVMVLALIATFIITPLLLSYTRLISVWDLLTVSLQSQVIKECRLFESMRPSQIKKTILLSHIETFSAGEKIIREGEQSNEFFVLLEGKASVQVLLPDNEAASLGKMQAGDVFGEIALVSQIPRTADVVATTDIRVLVMDWESITRVKKVYPRISAQLFQNIAAILGQRLAHSTASNS